MILCDFSQVMISNLMVDADIHKTGNFSEDLLRHKVLNSLRYYNVKFGEDYGELVICCDSKEYWRKDYFPYYKATRKKDRDNSSLDWGKIFDALNKIKDELKENFPYRVLEILGAEADDIIGTLCYKYHLAGEILILSGDKDFAQLQQLKGIHQYAPIQKHFISAPDAKKDLKIQILKGDRGDGVPNFLSPDDVFLKDRRQVSLTSKNLEKWVEMNPEAFCTTAMLRGYKRNETLIDLRFTPKEIKEAIIAEFEKPFTPNRSRMLNYFIKNRMKVLMDLLQEF